MTPFVYYGLCLSGLLALVSLGIYLVIFLDMFFYYRKVPLFPPKPKRDDNGSHRA